MTQHSSQTILDQLGQLVTSSTENQQDTVTTAKQWIEVISKNKCFLDDHNHDIVFIGSVGVGKSSLIGIAANLLVGDSPKDKASLKNNSVLAIGGGRTTICEVRIRATKDDDEGRIGLIIDPFSADDMKKEIEIYAEDQWRRRQPSEARIGMDDIEIVQESPRAIRGMTGYNEYQETVTEGGIKKRRTIRPLDVAISQFDSLAAFSEHLLERANLSARTQNKWWWDKHSLENLKALKNRFEAINLGTEPSAMLPRRMTVVVPEPLPSSQAKLNLTLIDTRGLDGVVESRDDLQEFVRDPRALLVLCATFKDAPGDAVRTLLRFIAGDAELRQSLPRTLLVLLDQGDAEQVNGADGDREFGKELKIDECYIALEGAGLTQRFEKNQIIAFDVLNDSRNSLLDAIDCHLKQLRQKTEDYLSEQIDNASLFLDSAEDQLRPVLRKSVDDALIATMSQHLPVDIPLRDPLQGLYRAVDQTRYASVIYATCRRNGTYPKLNLYAAIEAEASQAATRWLDDLMDAIFVKLNELEKDPHYKKIQDDIRLRKNLYQSAQFRVIRHYAEQIVEQVYSELKDEPVWQICCQEWGRGNGFKNKVIEHIEIWSRKQQRITAHEHTEAGNLIWLLREVSRPAQSPRFSIHVRNLRALRKVNWSPEPPLTVLIGANGAGKTTLLQTLKLLSLAYQRGLSEAVRIVLGGSSNLRTWGINEEEPVEIGLDIGEVSWRIQLVEREGSVDYLNNEHLFERGRMIFSRDSLGEFFYADERIEPSQQLGLRALMDRGVHDPALRVMAVFLQNISVYHDPDLWTLRHKGSDTTEDRNLNPRGNNALALLRRWHQERANNHRYRFVIEGLAAAFPNTFETMDFVEAGNTLVARVYRLGKETPSPLSDEANGVLQLLILFCEIAGAESDSVIAIDEPENSLHPYALRAFLRRTTRWAREHNLTVLLATHSTVLLDELTGNPEQIYVMKKPVDDEYIPSRLDRLCDSEWLEGFKLGDLYEQGEIGSNEDEG
ncbi:MAG: AAA family ATPase [Methylococcales bacterium]|nr:AAA family ATPase [Methylococcales bacterium]